MKLSKETVGLIKNFAGINSNLLLKSGNKLATISAQKNVMADAVVTETFPDFGIYDLNEFLGALSLLESPHGHHQLRGRLVRGRRSPTCSLCSKNNCGIVTTMDPLWRCESEE